MFARFLLVSLFHALRGWRFLSRPPKAGDLVHFRDAWAIEVEGEGFSLLEVWFPKFPRTGTARLLRETATHWDLTFWCRHIRLGKERNTLRPLNRAGRWTAFDLIAQGWVARQLALMRPPDDAPEPPPPPLPLSALSRHWARKRGGLATVHALGGRYHSWPGLLLRRWLHEKTRYLLGVPSPGIYMGKGPLVQDCRAILTFAYRGERRRLRLDQVRRHQNDNIHLLGRQLPGGEQRSFAFHNIFNLEIEGFGPIDARRLDLDLAALETNAWDHWRQWNRYATSLGYPLPDPDLATRIVGKVWRQLIRPYWAYIRWRYPRYRLLRPPTWRTRLAQRAEPVRKRIRRAALWLNWLWQEYRPQPAPQPDLSAPDARWRRFLRDMADRLDAGQTVDIRNLRHVAKLARQPMLARKMARHILRVEKAALGPSDPDRAILDRALRLSPDRRRLIPDHELRQAQKVGGTLFLHYAPFQRLYDIPRPPDPAMIVLAYLRALYRSDFWNGPKGHAPPHIERGDFRVLLLAHLGQPDGRRWVFAKTAAARLRKLADL